MKFTFPNFWFTLPNLQAFPGTWHVKIEINSQQVVYVPIEVVLTPTPNFNRPPAPISAHLEPADPSPDRAVFCRVDTDPVMDDLDWDLLQYRYQWRVNGNIVRDNVFAGHADALRKGAFNLGDTVQCTVTANDGHVNGTPVSVQAVAQSHPWLDLGFAKYRSSGVPHLEASGPLVGGVPITLSITQAQPSGFVYLFWSLWAGYTPAFGATMVPTFIADPIVIPTDAAGNATLTFPWFYGFASGIPLYIQAWSIENPLPPYEVSTTNGIVGTMP